MIENCPARCGLTAGCRFCRQVTIPMGLVAVPRESIPDAANVVVASSDELAATRAQLAILKAERDELAGRLDLLWRQRSTLLRLLRSIKRNGGCGERHWRFIDRVLQVARKQTGRVVVTQAEEKSRPSGQ